MLWNFNLTNFSGHMTDMLTCNSHARIGVLLVFNFLYMAFPCQNEVAGQVYMAISMSIYTFGVIYMVHEASGEVSRHISQSYLILLSDILFSEVLHADDVSAKIW